MKFFLLLFSVLLASASAGKIFDDALREFFEYVKQQMPYGFPAVGLPPLAPYKKDFGKFHFTNRGLDLSGNLTNLVLDGLTVMEIRKLTYIPLEMVMKYDLAFKQIKIFSQYVGDDGFKLLRLPMKINEKGDLDLLLDNVRYNGSFFFRMSAHGLRIRAYESNIQVNNIIVESKTTGIRNSELLNELYKRWISTFLMQFLADKQYEINREIMDIIVPAGNIMLDKVVHIIQH